MKLRLSLLIIALIIFGAFGVKTFAQDVTTEATVEINEETVEKEPIEKSRAIAFVKQIPKFLGNFFEKIIDGMEAWRLKTLTSIQEHQIEIKNKIDEAEALERDPEEIVNRNNAWGNGVIKPIRYPELVFYNVIEPLFEHKVVFYGIIVMTVLIIMIRIFS